MKYDGLLKPLVVTPTVRALVAARMAELKAELSLNQLAAEEIRKAMREEQKLIASILDDKP